MSATIQTIISCDGSSPRCEGNDWSADMCHQTAAEQRASAKENRNWKQLGGRDYCPACWKTIRNSMLKSYKRP